MGTTVIVRPISARKDEFMKRGRIPRGDKFWSIMMLVNGKIESL